MINLRNYLTFIGKDWRDLSDKEEVIVVEEIGLWGFFGNIRKDWDNW